MWIAGSCRLPRCPDGLVEIWIGITSHRPEIRATRRTGGASQGIRPLAFTSPVSRQYVQVTEGTDSTTTSRGNGNAGTQHPACPHCQRNIAQSLVLVAVALLYQILSNLPVCGKTN